MCTTLKYSSELNLKKITLIYATVALLLTAVTQQKNQHLLWSV
jgi:hypothetical protein